MIKILLTQRDGQGGEKMLENALKSVKEAEEKAAAAPEADGQHDARQQSEPEFHKEWFL